MLHDNLLILWVETGEVEKHKHVKSLAGVVGWPLGDARRRQKTARGAHVACHRGVAGHPVKQCCRRIVLESYLKPAGVSNLACSR